MAESQAYHKHIRSVNHRRRLGESYHKSSMAAAHFSRIPRISQDPPSWSLIFGCPECHGKASCAAESQWGILACGRFAWLAGKDIKEHQGFIIILIIIILILIVILAWWFQYSSFVSWCGFGFFPHRRCMIHDARLKVIQMAPRGAVGRKRGRNLEVLLQRKMFCPKETSEMVWWIMASQQTKMRI